MSDFDTLFNATFKKREGLTQEERNAIYQEVLAEMFPRASVLTEGDKPKLAKAYEDRVKAREAEIATTYVRVTSKTSSKGKAPATDNGFFSTLNAKYRPGIKGPSPIPGWWKTFLKEQPNGSNDDFEAYVKAKVASKK